MTLRAENVGASRGGRKVVHAIDFEVHPGEVVALIGPNAAGKSTLLELLAGERPDSGRVCLDDHPLTDWAREALARRRAVLPQASSLMFPFRALEIVLLGRSPHAGYSDADTDRAIAAAALREAGVAHLAERYYNQLSGGERQRVQLARVLAQVHDDGRRAAARFLLLDEPTNNLDPAHQQAVMQTARRFADAGNGVVAVLHDPNLASLHADRIAVLAGGSVVADGAPEAVMTAELMESVYGYRVTVLQHPERACPVLMPA